MKLYQLSPVKWGKDTPWRGIYDCATGFVVMAQSEVNARLLAAEQCGDEGPEAWLFPQHSTCEELTTGNEEMIVLRSFHAG